MPTPEDFSRRQMLILAGAAVLAGLSVPAHAFSEPPLPPFRAWVIPIQDLSLALSPRETELRGLIGIGSGQQAAWIDYVLARRAHEKNVKLSRRKEMREFALGKPAFEPTLSDSAAENPVERSKLVLREKFDRLYALLDNGQKAQADRVLTPAECGR